MKLLALPFAVALALPLVPRAAEGLAPSPEAAAVERAVQDYVEALYLARPELIERSVHPALVKRGLYRPDGAAEYRAPARMTYEQLYELAGSWNDAGQQGDELAYSIDVLNVLDVTASARLSALWGVDHMQLEKRDGVWRIVHVLWQSHPRVDGDRGGD